jgi:hypothetical protein
MGCAAIFGKGSNLSGNSSIQPNNTTSGNYCSMPVMPFDNGYIASNTGTMNVSFAPVCPNCLKYFGMSPQTQESSVPTYYVPTANVAQTPNNIELQQENYIKYVRKNMIDRLYGIHTPETKSGTIMDDGSSPYATINDGAGNIFIASSSYGANINPGGGNNVLYLDGDMQTADLSQGENLVYVDGPGQKYIIADKNDTIVLGPDADKTKIAIQYKDGDVPKVSLVANLEKEDLNPFKSILDTISDESAKYSETKTNTDQAKTAEKFIGNLNEEDSTEVKASVEDSTEIQPSEEETTAKTSDKDAKLATDLPKQADKSISVATSEAETELEPVATVEKSTTKTDENINTFEVLQASKDNTEKTMKNIMTELKKDSPDYDKLISTIINYLHKLNANGNYNNEVMDLFRIYDSIIPAIQETNKVLKNPDATKEELEGAKTTNIALFNEFETEDKLYAQIPFKTHPIGLLYTSIASLEKKINEKVN